MASSWLRKEAKGTSQKTITDADYADDLALLANTPHQAETLLHSLERAAAGIGLHVNAQKTEYMCYNQTGNITTLDGASLRLVDKFTYLGSSVSSTENDIDTRLTKAWTAIDRLSIIWKSDLTDEMKRSFFQAAVVSILLYGCTTWTLTKRLEKKLDGNYTRNVESNIEQILATTPHETPTVRPLASHHKNYTGQTSQTRRTLLEKQGRARKWRTPWTPTYGQAKAGWLARTYIQQLCEDTGCNPEDLPEAMNDREKWREMVKDIRAGGTTWWWWWHVNDTSLVVFTPNQVFYSAITPNQAFYSAITPNQAFYSAITPNQAFYSCHHTQSGILFCHHTQSGILVLVYMIQLFLFSSYKEIYKCKLVNSSTWFYSL